jgi:hypothetical protein
MQRVSGDIRLMDKCTHLAGGKKCNSMKKQRKHACEQQCVRPDEKHL